MEITSDEQLMALLLEEMDIVIDRVATKLTLELEKMIKLFVYDAYRPTRYQRQGMNGGLLGNWEQLSNKRIKNRIISIIRENTPTQLEHNPDDFIHGSNYWKKTDDIRDILVDIVTHLGSYTAGPLFGDGPWVDARDFWTPFTEMLKDGTIEKLLESEFRRSGIKYIKV